MMKVVGTIGHNFLIGEALSALGDDGYQTEIITQPSDTGAAMTSRLLVLEGLENNNQQTANRGIFIHGTNLEGNLGKPDSHGCIRMKNADVIELEKIFHEFKNSTLMIIYE